MHRSWIAPGAAAALDVAWRYMRLNHPPAPSDAILVLGSFDDRAAVRAAELWHEGFAPALIMSGGIAHQGGLLDTGWGRSEAAVFADVAVAHGVPRAAIFLEDRAQNTGENFALTKCLAEREGLSLSRLLVVAKPYMTRRGWLTGRKVWPEAELRMQSEDVDAATYLAREAAPDRVVQALVGDLHRIMVYPRLGFQVEDTVSASVQEAFRTLVDAGYGTRLVPGYPA